MTESALHLLTALLVLGCGAEKSTVQSYSVEPKSVLQSGTAAGDRGVAQTVTATFDSVDFVELFVGDVRGSSRFRVEVREAGNGPLVARSGEVASAGRYRWLKFSLTPVTGRSFERGAQYEFRFTRADGDSVPYFWRPVEHPGLGALSAGSESRSDRALSLRVHGVNRALDEHWLGANCNFVRLTDASQLRVLDQARDSLGVGFLREDVTTWNIIEHGRNNWTWNFLDACRSQYADHGMKVLGLLAYGNSDSAITTKGPGTGSNRPRPDGVDKYPPRGLWYPAGPKCDTNYWARYVDRLTAHCPEIEYLEVGNEPNSFGEYFGFPDPRFYRDARGGPVRTLRASCSLYVRMCWLAKQVAGPRGKKIVAGSTTGVNWEELDRGVFSGASWLEAMFSIADSYPGGWRSCFDIVSVHPYQGDGRPLFDPVQFWADLDTARNIINRHGGRDVPLWVTEIGWRTYRQRGGATYEPMPGFTTESSARSLCQFLASSLGSGLRPQGGYDRVFWYELTDLRDRTTDPHWGFGLLDSTRQLRLTPMGRAARRLDSLVRGWRVCGYEETPHATGRVHVLTVENAKGRQGWLTWQSGIGTAPAPLRLPARATALAGIPLIADAAAPGTALTAGEDGWLEANASSLPTGYFTVDSPARPDIVVDSVRVTTAAPRAGERLDAVAFLRNVGTRTTPAGLPVVVTLSLDGTEVGRAAVRSRITAAASVTVSVRLPASAAGSRLLSAVANPDARFVELDADNNAAYAPVTILPRTR